MDSPPLPPWQLASLSAPSSLPSRRTRGLDTACCTLRSRAALSSTSRRRRGLARRVETVPGARGHPSSRGRSPTPSLPAETPPPVLVSLPLSVLQKPRLLHFMEHWPCAKHFIQTIALISISLINLNSNLIVSSCCRGGTPCFTEEETETGNLSNLARLTELERGRAQVTSADLSASRATLWC